MDTWDQLGAVQDALSRRGFRDIVPHGLPSLRKIVLSNHRKGRVQAMAPCSQVMSLIENSTDQESFWQSLEDAGLLCISPEAGQR